MNKIQMKLIAMALALTLSVSVVIMSSYAWMVLSSNPAATGIQVVIGGGNTILIAPDIQQTVDGEVYHIPGRFSDRMNFGMYDSYDYLAEIGGLTPVSTSDGIDWFLTGNKVDSFLTNANVPKYITDKDGNKNPNPAIREGNYIFLDFWVVAPAGDYTLRISTGKENENGGSFVIDLPVPVESEGKYVLEDTEGSAAAAVRIGFLANPVMLTDETMLCYTESPYKDSRFTALRGLYIEPNSGSYHSEFNNFVIYEPNADYHPGKEEELGTSYIQTKPFVLSEEGRAVENPDIWEQLAVQLKSEWYEEGYSIYQDFGTYAFNISPDEKAPEEVLSGFYGTKLQGQFAQFVKKGQFIKYSALNTLTESPEGSLKAAVEGIGKLSDMGTLLQSGTAEDVKIIELERNVPQRIRMFIWIEGQDIDCAASADSATFAVNIEFAGGTE